MMIRAVRCSVGDESFFAWRRLEQTAWWDWEHQVLAERLDDFRDVRHFLSLYGRER